MWAPDVYEGAPTSVTAFMSVGAEGRRACRDRAGVSLPRSRACRRIRPRYSSALPSSRWRREISWPLPRPISSGCSRTRPSPMQGTALLGIIAGTRQKGLSAVLTYLLIFMLSHEHVGAFAVVILRQGEEIKDYEGLARSHPLAAAAMLVFMFSLRESRRQPGSSENSLSSWRPCRAGHAWVVVIAVIFSAISGLLLFAVRCGTCICGRGRIATGASFVVPRP